MDVGKTPFLAVLRERMSFLNDRQRVLAENVANASTPKYVARDLDQRAFSDAIAQQLPINRSGPAGPNLGGPVTLLATRAGHISSQGGSVAAGRVVRAPDSETTLDGNAVVLEEQMIKVADTRMNYDAALGMYQKGLQLMRLAAKRPQ